MRAESELPDAEFTVAIDDDVSGVKGKDLPAFGLSASVDMERPALEAVTGSRRQGKHTEPFEMVFAVAADSNGPPSRLVVRSKIDAYVERAT